MASLKNCCKRVCFYSENNVQNIKSNHHICLIIVKVLYVFVFVIITVFVCVILCLIRFWFVSVDHLYSTSQITNKYSKVLNKFEIWLIFWNILKPGGRLTNHDCAISNLSAFPQQPLLHHIWLQIELLQSASFGWWRRFCWQRWKGAKLKKYIFGQVGQSINQGFTSSSDFSFAFISASTTFATVLLVSPLCYNIWYYNVLGKVAQMKIRKKSGLLPNPPRAPPPVWHFFKKKIHPHLFFENCIFNGRNEFYAWSHFKNK